jgi:hypothetical protein
MQHKTTTSLRHFETGALSRSAVALMMVGAVAHAQDQSDEGPSVTPYRPSVSTPASLSAPGYLELEAGGQREYEGNVRTDSVPYSLKLAFTPDWGVLVTGNAWLHERDEGGQSLSGFGDTSLLLKCRFAVNDASAFGIEAGVTFPTAGSGLGDAKADATVTGIYSADIGTFHTDLNLEWTHVGAVDAGISHNQILWAAALSRSFTERWGAVGEFSGTQQHGLASTSQFLLAASYNVSKTLVLDAGFAHSLRHGSSDRSIFAGLTVLGPRLFTP